MLTQSYRGSGATILSWSMVEWFAVAITALSAWTLGCSQSEPPPPPPPEPENEYAMLTERTEEVVPIEANDLGVPPSAIMKVGRHNLEVEPTTGRFPTGLSVVRVEAATQGDEPEHVLRPAPVEDQRDAYWAQVMHDLPMVREVTVLGTYGLDPRDAGWQNLLQSSLRVECGLCVIYAEVYETAADAEVVGVLWDAVTKKALAAYRVPAMVPSDERLKYEKKKKYIGLRSDARCRAVAELRQLVRDTIWDIAAQDSEPTGTQPNPWDTGMPLEPRDSRPDVRIYLDERPRK